MDNYIKKDFEKERECVVIEKLEISCKKIVAIYNKLYLQFGTTMVTNLSYMCVYGQSHS